MVIHREIRHHVNILGYVSQLILYRGINNYYLVLILDFDPVSGVCSCIFRSVEATLVEPSEFFLRISLLYQLILIF